MEEGRLLEAGPSTKGSRMFAFGILRAMVRPTVGWVLTESVALLTFGTSSCQELCYVPPATPDFT